MTASAFRSLSTVFLLYLALASPSFAEVELVTVDFPEDPVWVGQKASFFVKLRGRGPFVGASSFSLPQISRTVILKVGNPVVSSEEIEDESWFVQTHEFAVFSQDDGTIEIPSFQVRFTNRDGFTGPEQDHVEQVPAIRMEVKRPEGSKSANFLVTTKSLNVEEQWEPTPGEAEQGEVFHRTITQRADQVSGMALAPPSALAPDGVSVHFADPEIEDNTERGNFTGNRTDRITYVVEKAGTITLPAVEYVSWNPDSEQYDSTTLPTVTFEVAAPPPSTDTTNESSRLYWALWLVFVSAIGGLIFWQHDQIAQLFSALCQILNPPERKFARKLLRACRHNDANAAEFAWAEWQSLRTFDGPVDSDVQAAVADLYRHRYGPANHSKWAGSQLATAFRNMLATERQKTSRLSDLPPLNPTGLQS